MRVGVIGAGGVSRFHVQGYCKAGIQVAAVADLNTESAARLAATCGGRACSDYQDVLADSSIEAVSICLPNNLHFRAAAESLEAGKHVLCEKPMTTSLSDARELVRIAERSDKSLQVAYMKRYLPAFAAARRALSEIGEILSATIKVFHYFPEETWTKAKDLWGLQRESAGGGPLVHSGSHILDITNWWLGPIETASAKVRWRKGTDLDYHTTAALVTSSGVHVFFECAWLPLSHIGCFRDGWDERVEVTGDRGRVELFSTWWDRPEMTPFVRVYVEGEPVREIHNAPVSGFDAEVDGFLRAIQNGGRVSPDASDGLAVQEIIEAIYLAAERGSVVRLEDL